MGSESIGTKTEKEGFELSLHVGGLSAKTDDGPGNHRRWVPRQGTSIGDEVCIRILEAEEADKPAVEKPASDRDEKVLLVAITSDRGLCGPFNANVFKTVVELINTKYEAQYRAGDLQVLTIGRKSTEYFKKRKYNVIDDFSDIFSHLSFDKVRVAAEFVMKGYREEKFDKVELVYNEFKNIATQILKTEQFLPLQEAIQEETNLHNDFIYQPNQQVLVEELIPKSLKVQFYKAILESNASEHGARMTAMNKATENADEILKDLKLTYNQTRQAAITKEILEIVGGAEALG